MAEKRAYLWYRFCRGLCQVFCRLFVRLRVRGRENIPSQGAFLLVSNHQSFLDPLFCGVRAGRVLCFMARDSLFRSKLFGGLIRSVNAIPVRRGQTDIKAMRGVISRLKAGLGVCLYPEGTRTSDGKVSDFKAGVGLLCKKGKASVVPMVVEGAFECWPRSKKVFKPGCRIEVMYGEPIAAERVGQMDSRELVRELTRRVRHMQNQLRSEMDREPFDYGDLQGESDGS